MLNVDRSSNLEHDTSDAHQTRHRRLFAPRGFSSLLRVAAGLSQMPTLLEKCAAIAAAVGLGNAAALLEEQGTAGVLAAANAMMGIVPPANASLSARQRTLLYTDVQ